MGNYDHVFSPITIRGIEFKNRLQTAPQTATVCTPEGLATAEFIDYFRPYAQGGFGTVTIGDSVVDFDYAPGHDLGLDLGNYQVVTGLSELVESITRYGSQISIEINHSGRNAKASLLKGKHPIAPSPIPNAMEEMMAARQGREPFAVHEINEDQIAEVVEHFAAAANHCKMAGFNVVMIHGAHGHLISQFLSPYSNKRRDRWGGSLENRARFAVEVLDAVRKKCGPNLVIEYRISLNEWVPEGMGPEETLEFLKMIKDKIDIVHVSAGILANPETVRHMIQPLYVKQMYNVHLARLVKEHIDLPVTTVGSIMNLDNAEKILAEGWADFVSFARAALADPEMPRKIATGRGIDVRPCIRCNCCTQVSVVGKNHRCAINPMAGRGSEFDQHEGLGPARTKKKVMVVGGGPAGMQAAQTAVQRGHNVVLYEMTGELGGMIRVGAELPFKSDLKTYVDWMIDQTEKCGAKLVFDTEVTAETVTTEKPDALIIAVGATPLIPNIPGIDSPKVCWAGDVDAGKAQVGQTVIVVGAGLTGIETAVNLGSQGKRVTVIEMLGPETVLADISASHRYYLWEKIAEYGINIVTNTKLEAVTDKGIRAVDKDKGPAKYDADSIVLAIGMRARREKVAELRRLVPETEVFVVGDCAKPRTLFWANHDGFNAVCDL